MSTDVYEELLILVNDGCGKAYVLRVGYTIDVAPN